VVLFPPGQEPPGKGEVYLELCCPLLLRPVVPLCHDVFPFPLGSFLPPKKFLGGPENFSPPFQLGKGPFFLKGLCFSSLTKLSPFPHGREQAIIGRPEPFVVSEPIFFWPLNYGNRLSLFPRPEPLEEYLGHHNSPDIVY